MRIVILSDTHIPKRAKQLPARLMDRLKRAQAIIHAGDWVDLAVYRELSRCAPVYGVAGNCDPPALRRKLGRRRIIELGGWRIGITHGDGQRGTTRDRALASFAHERLDLLVFGHSHIPYKKKHGKMIVFNPGSPTDKRRNPHYSFGFAQLGKKISLKHVYFSDRSD